MRIPLRIAGPVLALLSLFGQAPAAAAPQQLAATVAAVEKCQPGGPCAHHLPVRVVIVTMFEIGKDSGDAPGEARIGRDQRRRAAGLLQRTTQRQRGDAGLFVFAGGLAER